MKRIADHILTPLWQSKTRYPSKHGYPTLKGSHPVYDVVVVGGGIVGLTTAMMLKEQGKKVAIVEALSVGQGVTGNSSCKLSVNHNMSYQQIFKSHGNDGIRHYAGINRYGMELIKENIKKYKIECEHEVVPDYTYATDESEVESMRYEVEVMRDAGIDARLVLQTSPGVGLPDIGLPPSVSSQIRCAIEVLDQAQFNAYDYTVGMAQAFHTDDTPIFENSRVTNVSKRAPHKVETPEGNITANHVVIATHIPILDFSGHFGTMEPSCSYCIAMTVNDESTLPKGMYISSTQPTRSLRTIPTPDGKRYLMIAGNTQHVGEADGAEQMNDLEQWARKHFDVGEVVSKWFAHDYMTPDKMPYIGRMTKLTPSISTTTGLLKWGLAMGAGSSRVLCDSINDIDNAWARTFDATRWDLPGSIKDYALLQLKVGKEFIGDRIKDAIPTVSDIEDLKNDESAICWQGTQPIAAYRDELGKLHAVSAVCQHLKCHVRFNSAVKTWDCPCHGSRYSLDGEVIHGPSVKNLVQAKDLKHGIFS